MTGKEIVERAKSLSAYKYWYGGKRELASVSLAKRLKSENPSVWTDAYYERALADVDGKTRVCDCSGLVCYAYNIGDISSWSIKQRYKSLSENPNGDKTPKAGMIGWKSGHVGIFSRDGWDAPIIEMRSQAYDYQCSRTCEQCGFTAVLYSDSVDYSLSENEKYKKVGWYSDNKGWWYRHTYGAGPDTYYHDCTATINGHKYIFDADGYICLLNRVSPTSKTGWIS